MPQEAAACAVVTAVSETNAVQIAKVIKMIRHKWLIFLVFVVIIIFFAYLIYSNVHAIWSLYANYKKQKLDANQVAVAVAAVSNGITSIDDDEKYEVPAAVDQKSDTIDNKVIRQNIASIKQTYGDYNKLVKQYNPESSDLVDEKIMSAAYDNY